MAVGYLELIDEQIDAPDLGAEEAVVSMREALLAQVIGNHAAQAAIVAGWDLGESHVPGRAEALTEVEDALFMTPDDVERQVGSTVRREAMRLSRQRHLDMHLVHGAALFALALSENTMSEGDQ